MRSFNPQSIITPAARHRLPAVYPLRLVAADGGLSLWSRRVATTPVPRIVIGILEGVETPGYLPSRLPAYVQVTSW